MGAAQIVQVDFQRASSAAVMQRQLKACEHSADQVTSDAGEMLGKMIRIAEESGVHRTKIQRQLLRLHSAIGHSLRAQMDLQIFHQGCRNHMDTLDLQVLGWGDTSDTPKMDAADYATAEAGS